MSSIHTSFCCLYCEDLLLATEMPFCPMYLLPERAERQGTTNIIATNLERFQGKCLHLTFWGIQVSLPQTGMKISQEELRYWWFSCFLTAVSSISAAIGWMQPRPSTACTGVITAASYFPKFLSSYHASVPERVPQNERTNKWFPRASQQH